MKPFALWLVIAGVLFGGMCGAYHVYLTEHPRKVLVAVDTSYPMKPVWDQVPGILKNLSAQRYARFALVTEKSKVHDWSFKLEPGKLTPYAPRDLSRLNDYPEIKEASFKFLITNAPPPQTGNMGGWKIVRMGE
jgi:hypothetical protein